MIKTIAVVYNGNTKVVVWDGKNSNIGCFGGDGVVDDIGKGAIKRVSDISRLR